MNKKLFYIILAIVLGGCQQKSPSHEELPQMPELFVAGYLPHYGMNRFDLSTLSHIDRVYYFSLSPDVDGKFQVLDRDFENLIKLSTALSNTNCELFVVIGGWIGSEYIHTMASAPELRESYIQELVRFCNENDVVGVDLDWENYPHAINVTNYEALVGEMSSFLKSNGIQFTVALGVTNFELASKIFTPTH